jgi:CheY-like chemotaxis protein/nitrogen-specific signal transduction histidine kinase
VQAALRARLRQYELRDVLVALHTARTEAERANRLKDEFLATLSHELRTPLNAILGWISMLRRGQVADVQVPKVLEIVERNAKAQAQLIAAVLDVSRMITGRIRLQLESVPIAALVVGAVDSVRPTADAKGVVLDVHADDEAAALVHGDAARLQQVFWNLLSNAIKFTPAGGRVTVALRRDGGFVECAVEDTGIGLSPEFLPFAFDRFRQADQTFTRAHGGLGLGLAIVKHLVEMHGGQVTASSEGAGRGATFTVRLPLAADARTAPTSPAEPAPGDCAGFDFAQRLILVVDDDPTTRELMTAMLEACHARVKSVDGAAAAIRQIDDEVPALLIADIGMPVEDGLSLMRRVRQRLPEAGGSVPSIALSAYARADDRRSALDAGYDDFLTKPAMPADIARTIARWLGDEAARRKGSNANPPEASRVGGRATDNPTAG